MEKINKLDKSFTQVITQLLIYRNSRSRSSHQKCSIIKMFLKYSQYSQENTCVGVFFNKVAGLRLANVLKKRLQHRCFPVNVAELFKNTYFEEHLRTAASGITNSKT